MCHLKDVLARLAQAGLTAKPLKCKIAYPNVVSLGHNIGGGVIKPVTDTIDAVLNFPRPLTKTQLSEVISRPVRVLQKIRTPLCHNSSSSAGTDKKECPQYRYVE